MSQLFLIWKEDQIFSRSINLVHFTKSPLTSLGTLHKNKNKIAQEDKTVMNNNILRVLIIGHVEMEYLGENKSQTTFQKQKRFLLIGSDC